MRFRLLLLAGVLAPLCLFGARQEKNAWEKAWQQGMERYKQGQYAEAVPSFEAVVRLLPERASGHAMLGKCKYNLGDYRGALESFETAHRLAPEDGDAACRLAAAHLALKQYDQVLKVVEAFDPSRVPADSRADCCRAAGLAALALGDPPRAADHFARGRDAAGGERRNELQAWLVKALIQAARQARREDQGAAYARALPEAEALAAADPGPEAHRLAAEAALAAGAYPQAERHARAVLAALPEDPYGALYLGQALSGQERYREAVEPLEAATRLLPDEGRWAAWNPLGYAWERLGERERARECYVKAENGEKVRKLSEAPAP
jgi:tetratricopeptide (TPR) repeat protein